MPIRSCTEQQLSTQFRSLVFSFCDGNFLPVCRSCDLLKSRRDWYWLKKREKLCSGKCHLYRWLFNLRYHVRVLFVENWKRMSMWITWVCQVFFYFLVSSTTVRSDESPCEMGKFYFWVPLLCSPWRCSMSPERSDDRTVTMSQLRIFQLLCFHCEEAKAAKKYVLVNWDNRKKVLSLGRASEGWNCWKWRNVLNEEIWRRREKENEKFRDGSLEWKKFDIRNKKSSTSCERSGPLPPLRAIDNIFVLRQH